MSLSRQFISLIIVLLLLVFVGTLTISTRNTQAYLNQQLLSNAQDTATSLGLSLRPILEQNDTALLNSTVDAIFDRGYYQRIQLKQISGETLLQRSAPVQFKGVPEWFTTLFPLSSPDASTTITAGWKQIATLHVSSHPGYAYNELWRIASHNFWWLLSLSIAAILITIVMVHILLKPLRAVERQARAISERQFTVQKKLPKTPELRKVAKAMNHMSAKVAQMLSAQTALTETMRARAYEDSLTQLQNRRGFEERLQHIISSPEEFQHGAIFLLRLWNLDEINKESGYLKGDELLKETAEIARFSCKPYTNATLARIGGADLAILMPNITPEEAATLADELCQRLSRLHIKGHIATSASTSLGIAYFTGTHKASELLGTADMALRTAHSRGANQWHLSEHQGLARSTIHNASEWKELLTHCVEKGELFLQQQPVYDCAGQQVLHYEILARIQDQNDHLVPAGVFMPIAERYELANAVDILVISKTLELMQQETVHHYAVNISATSLLAQGFIQWLGNILRQHPGAAQRLTFETAENSLPQDTATLQHAIEQLEQMGSRLSLDHFGTGSPSFGYLRNLKLDYLKIDGSYIRNIDSNEDNQFFLKALIEIAHGLDIKVIAEYVERDEEKALLAMLGCDGVQGYLLGSPGSL